jgi:hypothetical protein
VIKRRGIARLAPRRRIEKFRRNSKCQKSYEKVGQKTMKILKNDEKFFDPLDYYL